jgi:hypothetical protein
MTAAANFRGGSALPGDADGRRHRDGDDRHRRNPHRWLLIV